MSYNRNVKLRADDFSYDIYNYKNNNDDIRNDKQ